MARLAPTRVDNRVHQRAILGMGRGRVIAATSIITALMPLVVLHRYAEAPITTWANAAQSGAEELFWSFVSTASQPLTWFAIAVVGFGIAAAYNWSNTSRWMGMLLFSLLVAGLADIAVVGRTSGAATAGAVATVLSLWSLRLWPIWVGMAILMCLAKIVVEHASATQAAMGAMLGALSVLLVDYAWHHAYPESPPRRNAPLQS